jgi:hypothetical protein
MVAGWDDDFVLKNCPTIIALANDGCNQQQEFMGKLFSSERGSAYYMVLGTICAVIPLPLFWAGYLCIKYSEYWPLILFGTTTYFMWLIAYRSFRTARGIKRTKNGPTNEA